MNAFRDSIANGLFNRSWFVWFLFESVGHVICLYCMLACISFCRLYLYICYRYLYNVFLLHM
jgi:hypothetical protein